MARATRDLRERLRPTALCRGGICSQLVLDGHYVAGGIHAAAWEPVRRCATILWLITDDCVMHAATVIVAWQEGYSGG